MPTHLPDRSMEGTVLSAWPLLSGQITSLFYTKLDAWYECLTPLSKIVFISSILGSSALVLYGSLHVKRRHGETSRVTALLAAMLLVLAGLLLLLPPSSPTALRERVDGAIVPNLRDAEAADAQYACPGYKASNVAETPVGLTADLILAGDPCNIYGTDIEALSLVVEYQAADRLHIEILPKYVGQGNQSWFVLPDALVTKPRVEDHVKPESDLAFSWNNEPTFSFNVTRKSTGDVLFTTEGSELVYEDQFIEFESSLPENYNLYGLGETIHSFRLGNNLTSA